MTHLPCQWFLIPLKRKQHSIAKIDLPSSEGPAYHDVKHARTKLCSRRLNVIEIVAQSRQEVSIVRFKSLRLSYMTKMKLSLRIIEQSCCKGSWDIKIVTLQDKTIVLSGKLCVVLKNGIQAKCSFLLFPYGNNSLILRDILWQKVKEQNGR